MSAAQGIEARALQLMAGRLTADLSVSALIVLFLFTGF